MNKLKNEIGRGESTQRKKRGQQLCDAVSVTAIVTCEDAKVSFWFHG